MSSTAPWNQPRNGTTITVWDGDSLPQLPELVIHYSTKTERLSDSGAKQHGLIHLISWRNLNYPGTQV